MPGLTRTLQVRWLPSVVAGGVVLSGAWSTTQAEFYMGADVSLEPFMQSQGVTFKQNGVAAPEDQILYDAGANLFRLRLFVNPPTTYTNSNVGAIQSLAYDISLAQQLKADAPNAKLLLDLHYSDTWADPSHQAIPSSWSGQTLAQLQSTVQSYTASTLSSFKSADVMPDMVQIGNETNSGMLWPTGQLNFSGSTAMQKASWAAYGSLVNAAIAGVRQAQGTGAAVQIAMHVANGNTSGSPQFFYSKLTDAAYGNVNASSFDTMGVSFYPTATGDMATLKTNLTALATTYGKKLMVMETDAPWKTTTVASDPDYADTQAGQLQYLNDLRAVIAGLPNGTGEGLIYWYPEAVQVPGYTIYNGGSTALFDANGNALPALQAFATPEPASLGIISIGGLLMSRRRRSIAALCG